MRQRTVALAARPELWLGLLLLWTLLSALRAWHTPWARAAGTEALHWGSGLALALALGAGLRVRLAGGAGALALLLGLLVAAGVVEGLPAHGGGLAGPYGDHQLCAGALLALLPAALALGLAAPTPAVRAGGQAAAAAGALCLALTQTRAAWAGAAVAALVFASLWLRHSCATLPATARRRWVVPALLAVGVAGAGALLVAGADLGPALAARAGTLQSAASVSQDGSWRARARVWRGAAAMAAARPLDGWGLGRYPGAQWAWTRAGRPLAPAQRPSLSEQAHDFYLQTLVETGAVGLALYLAALAALTRRCLRALRAPGPAPSDLRPALLAATVSLIAGQGVDALASPSWQYPEVSLLFWAGLGLGLAATHAPTHARHAPDAPAPDAPALPAPALPALRRAAAGTAAVTVVAQFLPLGLLPALATYAPPGAGDTYVAGSATLGGPTAAAAGSTVTYQIMATYKSAASGSTYSANVTGDPNSTFIASVNGSAVGASTIDRPDQLITYTLPSLPAGTVIALRGAFKYGSGTNASANSTLTVQ